jgi:hypothetical protein
VAEHGRRHLPPLFSKGGIFAGVTAAQQSFGIAQYQETGRDPILKDRRVRKHRVCSGSFDRLLGVVKHGR